MKNIWKCWGEGLVWISDLCQECSARFIAFNFVKNYSFFKSYITHRLQCFVRSPDNFKWVKKNPPCTATCLLTFSVTSRCLWNIGRHTVSWPKQVYFAKIYLATFLWFHVIKAITQMSTFLWTCLSHLIKVKKKGNWGQRACEFRHVHGRLKWKKKAKQKTIKQANI